MSEPWQRLSVLVRQLQGMLDGKRLRVGYQALTFSGAADSDQPVVAHGLGAVPVAVFATAGYASGSRVVAVSFFGYDATSFTLRGRVVDGTAVTLTVDCFWLALA